MLYKVIKNKQSTILEITDSKNSLHAKIHLEQGASLQELTLNGHHLITSLEPLTYSTTYASSILFPFANRVKDGIYEFNAKNFQLDTNQKEENNALHGFIYNKTFQVIHYEISDNDAKITLEYIEKKKHKGFPYTYKIQLEYTFSKNMVSLKFKVKNTSKKPFPFTLGWHPYFLSDDLHNSSLQFQSDKKLIIGDRNIGLQIESIKPTETFEIQDKQLDDCWVLNSGDIKFITPKYSLSISSSEKTNFLQLYTPPKLNTIAIEPTTGVSNSFNNKIGLQVLQPKKWHEVTWYLKMN